ncbi:MAG: NAD-dependent epimerase/dehydratase family protein [Victivallaceae bacterium]|nr:NAD-dependent epimerase/dehydratase family protein [Victivallaceae bacterium]
MNTVIITGANGLIGSEAVRFFADLDFNIIGIDNDLRKYFFGAEASTRHVENELKDEFSNYQSLDIDIRDFDALKKVFSEYNSEIKLIIHTAAQPSHDWAAREPFTDFSVNANGTLNMLEATRLYCPEAAFIFTSTNKVYGDNPNSLPLEELETRWEIKSDHPYYANGIDENMSIDHCKHSIFGASKVAADIMVQEYGRYFGMKTGLIRGGCLTGPRHAGAELHGFLAYLMKCAVTGREYNIFGYKGKQVRDNIHCADLINAFYHFYLNPRCGEAYNMGGGRFSNCSMHEAIEICERITGKPMKVKYQETNRVGDHIWWISDISKFQSHYPDWQLTRGIEDILSEIHDYNRESWLSAKEFPKN